MPKRIEILRNKERKKAEILGFVPAFLKKHKMSPSLSDISKGVEIDLNAAHRYVDELIVSGHLTRVPRLPRSVAVTGKRYTPKQFPEPEPA